MNVSLGRTVVLASADAGLRQRLGERLSQMRWNVREAGGGAEAMERMDEQPTEALLLDHWLPDLEVEEFAGQISLLYPGVELLRVDGEAVEGGAASPRRHELLHALREANGGVRNFSGATQLEATGAAKLGPAVAVPVGNAQRLAKTPAEHWPSQLALLEVAPSETADSAPESVTLAAVKLPAERAARALRDGNVVPGNFKAGNFTAGNFTAIEEFVGKSAAMREVSRLVRLVAPRSATVLIEGETGTGKEVVAKALHRLSLRGAKPFVVLNCAAIPEALLEAELFGHTRGAFTGAVQSRTGRIEAANGGTLFLDEIGEMPMSLQAKMLRFLESGELQRVGENATLRVDVRVIAATHQPLEQRTVEGTFRLDLYHRLAVFPMDLPPLRERPEDIEALAEHFLDGMGRTSPRKYLSLAALEKLRAHDWPGNVRELGHVLERAAILAEDSPVIDVEEIRVRRSGRK